MLGRKDKSFVPVRNRNMISSLYSSVAVVIVLTKLSQLFDNEINDEVKV